MRKNSGKFWRLCFFVASVFLGVWECKPVMATERLVPSEYSTISEALVAAVDGDEIVLAAKPDGYSGAGNVNLAISGKQVTIRPAGDENAAAVTINCNGSATGYIRAFTLSNGAAVTLDRIKISNGYHSLGGAIAASGDDTSLTATGCTFDHNQAESNGGAVGVTGNVAVSLTDCVFNDNTSGDSGGALSLENGNGGIDIERCTFVGNSTYNFGGALYVDGVSNIALGNCLIVGNYADSYGGGVYLANSPFSTDVEDNSIINCTITENYTSVEGGGLKLLNSELILANSIVYGNITSEDEFGKYPEIVVDDSQMAYAHNIIRGGDEPDFNNEYVFLKSGSLAIDRGGNLELDPEFTKLGVWQGGEFTTMGDYHPVFGSYCYNSGKNSYLPDTMLVDMAGSDRLQDNYVDIGCYESAMPAGGDITCTAATATLKFPGAIVPGDKGKVTVTITNMGTETLTGEMGLRLYYSADEYISDYDDAVIYTTAKPLKLKMLAGVKKTIKKYSYSFTVPATIPAGSYYLLVKLDHTGNLNEFDRSSYSNVIKAGLVNTIDDVHNINWRFGTFNGRSNAVLIMPNDQGIINSYSMKSGQGQIAADRKTITLTGDTEAAVMTVATKTKGATATLGDITCVGSFSLNAAKCDLAGDITVSGVMPKLTIGNISDSTISIAGTSVNPKMALALTAGNVSNTNLLCPDLPVSTLKVKSWLLTGDTTPQITTTWIKKLACTAGNFQSNLTLSGVNATKNIALASATISGDVGYSRWLINGSVSKLTAATMSYFDLYLGTTPGLEAPTGSRSDFASQYSLGLAVKNSGQCLTDTRIMAYTITSASFSKTTTPDPDSIVEYYPGTKTLLFPANMKLLPPPAE